ncbi:hypothetical protein RK21_00690 [Pseudomonas plecoglossicida]|nr:hypothetical protein RK21_00690 [Pseudomonas plecoglossicida]
MDALPDAQQLRSGKGLPTVVVIAADGKAMPLTGKDRPASLQAE